MGTFIFRWPHPAEDVFVTGTFDDWGKTVQLDREGDGFAKEVSLTHPDKKILYKFVVDGTWTTDPNAPKEDDGHNNINNVLLPRDIHSDMASKFISTVTPDATTAQLAGDVPKESESQPDAPAPVISSVTPESTTAGLANQVPRELSGDVPGTFPDTPAKEPDQFFVNPIPATNGIGNPIHLAPGEKVPDPQTLTHNTIQSTVTTDQANYERDPSDPVLSSFATTPADAFVLPPISKNMIPESSLPIFPPTTETVDPVVTIQSVAPNATTATLAAKVPLEPRRQANGESSADGVPDVVKESISQTHDAPEAAANAKVVEEKKEVEGELLQKVPPAESSDVPATSQPPVATQGAKTEASRLGESTPREGAAPTAESKEKKRRNRASAFFRRLRERFQ